MSDIAPPPPPPGSAPDTIQDHRFPCDACGSDMRFDPAKGAMVCDHCGNLTALEGHAARAPAIRELDFRTALDAQLPEAEMEETRVSRCPNCGAEVEFRPEEHAKECPFCATPVVTDTGINRHIKPKGVLPFVLTEEAARDAMTKWLGKLWFAPNGCRTMPARAARWTASMCPTGPSTPIRSPAIKANAARSIMSPGRSRATARRSRSANSGCAGARPGGGSHAFSTTCWSWPRKACPNATPTRLNPGTCPT